MKKIISGLAFVAFVVFLLSGPVSCQKKPMNAEEYMESFTRFVDRIGQECDSYTAEDWAREAETFQLYTGPLYDRFEAELGAAEHLQFQQNRLRFGFLYQQFRAKEALSRGKNIIDETGEKFESIADKAKGLKNRLLDSLGNLLPKGGN
jgi:hypothetical protein